MATGADEIQSLVLPPGVGGTYTLALDGAATGPIAVSGGAAAAQDALNALPALAPAGVRVTGSGTTADPYLIRFSGVKVACAGQTLLVADGSGLYVQATPPAVQDAGFEDPAVGVGSFLYTPSGTAWSYGAGGGVAANGSGFLPTVTAPEGLQAGFLQGNGTATQSVAGWAAGSYALDFRAAQRSTNATSQQFEVRVDGATVATFRPSGTAFGALSTPSFSVAAGSHSVAFVGLNPDGGDNTILLDAVAIRTVDASSGTAPSTPPQVARVQAGVAATPASLRFSLGAYRRSFASNSTGGYRETGLLDSQTKLTLAFRLQVEELRSLLDRTGGATVLLMTEAQRAQLSVVIDQYGQLIFQANYQVQGEANPRTTYANCGAVSGPGWGASNPVPGIATHYLFSVDLTSGTITTAYKNGLPVAYDYLPSGLSGATMALGVPGKGSALYLGPVSNLDPSFPANGQYPGNFNAEATLVLDRPTAWYGYAATADDALGLATATVLPSQVAPGSIAFSADGGGGTPGAAVAAGDPGFTNRGLPDYDLAGTGDITDAVQYAVPVASSDGAGAGVTYADALAYTPPVVVGEARSISDRSILVTFTQAAGSAATLRSGTAQADFTRAGNRLTLSIRTAAGAVTYLDLDNPIWDPDAPGARVLFPLPSSTAIAPTDTLAVTAPINWAILAQGPCGPVDLQVVRGSLMPSTPPAGRTLKLGVNFNIFSSFGAPTYADARKSGGRWYGLYSYVGMDADGWPAVTGSNVAFATLVEKSNGGGFYEDPLGTYGYYTGPHGEPGRTSGLGPSPFWDNPAYGTAGARPGFGYRSIPRKGTVVTVWEGTSDSDAWVTIDRRDSRPPFDPANTDYAYPEIRQQMKAWEWFPAKGTTADGLKYRRDQAYELFDPQRNAADPVGSFLTPGLSVMITAGVTKLHGVYFLADPSLPEAAWNFDPENPPVFHPHREDAERAAEWTRFLDVSGANGTGVSSYRDLTPATAGWCGNDARINVPGYYYISLASVDPVDADLLAAFPARNREYGAVAKITTSVPHNMANGAYHVYDTYPQVYDTLGRPCTFLGGGTWVLSPTEFLLVMTPGSAATVARASGSSPASLAADVSSYNDAIAFSDGAVVDTYTVTVTTGSTGGDLTTARLAIATSSGKDDGSSVAPAASGVAFTYGRRSLKLTFASGGGDLVAGDSWTVRVAAGQVQADQSVTTIDRHYGGSAELGANLDRQVPATMPLADQAAWCERIDSGLWLNIPTGFLQPEVDDPLGTGVESFTTTQLRLHAREVIARTSPTRKVKVEPSNEPWNFAFPWTNNYHLLVGSACRLPGHGATLTVTALDSSGGIASIAIASGGRGYLVGRVYLRAATGSGFVGFATGDPVSGTINRVTILNPGTGYGTDPAAVTATVGYGAGARLAVASVSGGAIAGVTVNAGGSGYSAGFVRFLGGSGSGAWGYLRVDGSGAITGVTMGSGGSGYLGTDAITVEVEHSLFDQGSPYSELGTAYFLYALLGSRVGRIYREEWQAAGRDPANVELVLNCGPDLGQTGVPVVQALAVGGTQASALTAINAVAVNTYFENTAASTGVPTAAFEGLDADHDLDLFEAKVSTLSVLPGGWRSFLDAQGHPEIRAYSYEGALDRTLAGPPSPLYGTTNSDAEVAAKSLYALRQLEGLYSPRRYYLDLGFYLRQQEQGVEISLRYNDAYGIRPDARLPYMTPWLVWPMLLNFGEVPGIGDGSDGKHDNRRSTGGYRALTDFGAMAQPSLAAIASWNNPTTGQDASVAATSPTALTGASWAFPGENGGPGPDLVDRLSTWRPWPGNSVLLATGGPGPDVTDPLSPWYPWPDATPRAALGTSLVEVALAHRTTILVAASGPEAPPRPVAPWAPPE